MTVLELQRFALMIGMTLVSGFADAQGFIHAATIWQSGRLNWDALARSALGFGCGITMYWLVLRLMQDAGIGSPEVQTIFWFGVTIIGVALMSGSFGKWLMIDQLVACAVFIGIAWLLVRTGG